MRCNKKVLMIATTVMLGVGCIGLMGAMKYQNVKTEASDIKESEVAKAGIDVTSATMEGETPNELERKMDKEVVEKYAYKGYEISFIRYKDQKTKEYLSDKEQDGDYVYKKTFREIIDNAEKSGWNYMLEEMKGMKNQITAEVDWKRDEDQIVNGKYYGKLIRECNIRFKKPQIYEGKYTSSYDVIGWFSTIAETGKYTTGVRSSSSELLEAPEQWRLPSKEKRQEVKEKLEKCKSISNDKKAIYKRIEENKDKIIKELKEVYNINLVKIVKDSYYEKYKFAENEMNNGLIEIYGYMDDGQEIEVQYDLVGNYIYYVNYKYW